MRTTTLLAIGAGAMLLIGAAPTPTFADGRNPDGFGIYSPEQPAGRGGPRIYRYDTRSWYYRQPGFYPYYHSGYWVPRADMRYRYRYVYKGPRYQYVPAWGYDWWACESSKCR
jgi:hypothetical protein